MNINDFANLVVKTWKVVSVAEIPNNQCRVAMVSTIDRNTKWEFDCDEHTCPAVGDIVQPQMTIVKRGRQ
jgi:hypothetical protein